MFDKHSWPGTLLILFVFGCVSFVIAALLGFFVDPSMGGETRTRVVIGWVAVNTLVDFFVFLGRHIE